MANKIKRKQIFVFKIILTDFLDIDFALVHKIYAEP